MAVGTRNKKRSKHTGMLESAECIIQLKFRLPNTCWGELL